MVVNPVPELSPYYYRNNFILLCDVVEQQYTDLLSPDEQDFLKRIRALDHGSQCLFVRLVCRVGPIFRTAKLCYQEIGDLETPLSGLIDSGLASKPLSCTVSEMGSLYTKPELVRAFGSKLEVSSQCRKEQLLINIETLNLSPQEYYTAISAELDSDLLEIHGGEFVELFQLLFFGNRHQSLTDFVLSDLGLMNYYPYALDRNRRLFESRDAVDEYLACRTVSDRFYELLEMDRRDEVEVLGRQMLTMNIQYHSSVRRWERTCLRVARELERTACSDLALDIYRRCTQHPARERMARIHESNSDWEAAAMLLVEMQAEPLCEAELEAALRIHKRVLRKTGGATPASARNSFDEIQVIIPRSDSVERGVAKRLSGDWKDVYFLENSLMNTLFGLAFWEQIFADVAGVFHNPYQTIPADMFDGTFFKRRETEINTRLAELRNVDLRMELNACRERFENYQCRWVDWYQVCASLQDQALRTIPADHLLAIWERQLFDAKENRTGFPDLIAFGNHPGDYCMIEVKGPGDRLQDNQKRWLRYFSKHNIPAKVAWVTWSDA